MASAVHRFEVSPRPGTPDPIGAVVARDGAQIGVRAASVRATHVYLVQAALSAPDLDRLRAGLLADPVTEVSFVGAAPVAAGSSIVEVHPLPGVMDPVALSVQHAIRDLLGVEAEVATGWRYDLAGVGPGEAEALARRLLANPVIHRVETAPYHPERFPRGTPHDHEVRSVPMIGLSDDALTRLSREAHLFLSLDEMKAVQAHYRSIGRDPRDIELETLAQTWSEHCVHKTLKSTVRYKRGKGAQGQRDGGDPICWEGRPGHVVQPDGTVVINNLLKSTVAAATFELIKDGVDWTLSVFKDNSGVVALDDRWGVCIKVETHNHPSAIEPYGGAATGVGGCIRDVIGTGLGAQPIANTDVFCVARPDRWQAGSAQLTANSSHELRGKASDERCDDVRCEMSLPPGTLHPRRILSQVVAGVRDYGNRMGIPTINGAVSFDDRYVGNPLVFCGCIGLIPRDKVTGAAKPGDRIIALGGRTGRDGIHGATFSSAELEETASDEFSHAVQIGNAITEKQTLDAIMRARDFAGGPLYHGMTDCGAGGFSSAVGEMGKDLGAEVHLDRAPLKYPGLSYTEIWISEAQERMVLAVPPKNLAALKKICDEEGVEMADLGEFGTPQRDLVLHFHGREVGRISMHLLHEGIPMPVREAEWRPTQHSSKAAKQQSKAGESTPDIKGALFQLLAHPNIASKHWIIRQYDHEVRGATVLKPLVGPHGRGPGDGSVLEPIAGSGRGIAVACGLQTGIGDPALGGDPYLMALAAIDECVRNLVCVGADPARIAILDNFCWPSCGKTENMGSLVRAAEGCYEGAKAYRTPFVSGKDSLNNQLKYTDPATGTERVIEIPPTLLITGLGMVPRIERCVTSDAKAAGNVLMLVGAPTQAALGGSHVQALAVGLPDSRCAVPTTDLRLGPAAARTVASLIQRGMIRSAHDVSDGGVLVAVAEMLIGALAGRASLGATIDLADVHTDTMVAAFSESPSRYVLEVGAGDAAAIAAECQQAGIVAAKIGTLDTSGLLVWAGQRLSCVVGDLAGIWTRPLDW